MKESIIGLCVVIFLVILCVASCSAGGEDSTGENWILAIILLLAWLKGK